MSAEMTNGSPTGSNTTEPFTVESADAANAETGEAMPEVESATAEVEAKSEAKADLPSNSQATLEALIAGVESLKHSFQNLHQDFDAKLRYDATKERMVEKLHTELQSHREGLHAKVLRPVLIDLIQLYDDLTSIVDDAPPEEITPSERQLRQNLQTCITSLEETMVRQDVEIYSEEGDAFVAGRQRAINSQTTHERGLDKHVAVRLRKGFSFENRVLRPEWVTTYKFEELTDPPASAPAPTTGEAQAASPTAPATTGGEESPYA